jgi:PKD repeat protein
MYLLCAMLILCGVGLALAGDWTFDLTVTGTPPTTAPKVMTRIIGGNSSALDTYDTANDVLSPPPPMAYYSYFQVSGASPSDKLTKDVKNWVSPYTTAKTWTLKIINTEDTISTTITWVPAQIPADGAFTLTGVGTVNMRTQSSVTFDGNKNLQIKYQPNNPPTANAGGPYSGKAGAAIAFNGSGSSDLDSNPLTYDWNFGDGTAHGTGVNPAHTYASAGLYAVSLVVNDGMVNSSESQTTARVYSWFAKLNISGSGTSFIRTFGGDPAATADFDAGIDTISAPPPMTFYAHFAIAPVPNYLKADFRPWVNPYSATTEWALKVTNTSGNSTTIQWNASDLPAQGNFYLIGATVANINMRTQNSATFSGDKDLVIRYKLNSPPTANAGGPYSGKVGTAIAFDGSGSSDPDTDPLTYDWNFGDGSTHGTGVNPTHTYSSAFLYTAGLVVNDGSANSTESQAVVKVFSWFAKLNISGSGGSFIRTFGGDTLATVNYDANIDTISAPPPISFYAYFSISPMPNYLKADFRPWTAPYNTAMDWELKVVNASGSTTVQWNSSDLPPQGYFFLIGAEASNINMRTQNSVTFTDDKNLIIRYRLNAAPTANAGGPYVGKVGVPISFNGAQSSDPDSDPLAYDWNFGDGTAHGTGVNPAHAYAAAGSHPVALIVNDGLVNSSSNATTARVFSWFARLNVTGSLSYKLTIGGDPAAAAGFDSGVDTVAAPPPPEAYYAHLWIPVVPTYLKADFRAWISPYKTDIDWTLKVTNAEGVGATLQWDPADLPPQGFFFLVGAASSKIDMRNQSSVAFTGNKTMTIQYRQQVEVQYTFTVMGWYMVCLPVTPDDNSVSTLFPTALGGVAFTWDTASGSYVPVTHMVAGQGYWIALTEPWSGTIEGVPTDHYTIHFSSQGWYMISGVIGGADFSNPNDNPDGSVLSPAFAWDPVAQQYVPTTMLEERTGYWVAVFNACDLTVGGGGGGAGKASVNGDKDEFFRIYGAMPPAPPNEKQAEKQVETPKEYGMSQNYPNPFNPTTRIEYRLPEMGRVTLTVYDASGRKIRTLVDGMKSAGAYMAVWEGRNDAGEQVGSGIYMLQIRAGGFSKMAKMLLVK